MFTPRAQNPPLAIGLMLLATVFIAGTTLLAKALGTGRLGPDLHPLHVSHGRFLFGFLTVVAATLIMRPAFHRPHWPLHIARSILGWGGVTLMFAAVAFIPLSDATAISFLNPVFAMVFAIAFLREHVGPVRWAAAAIAFAGAIVLLRPGLDSFRPAALLALGAALVMGAEITCLKRLSGREGPFQILLINNAIALTVASLAVAVVWQTPTPVQWAALAGIGVLMAAAQMCYVNSVARADASLVVPFSYATLVFAAIYDLAVFGVIPDAVSILGALVIVAGGAMLAWREGRRQRRS
ncbi:MAG: DMT family transporter [Rhodobacter sp.]|nr:DMT family transporter [Rhodobacter sp.]